VKVHKLQIKELLKQNRRRRKNGTTTTKKKSLNCMKSNDEHKSIILIMKFRAYEHDKYDKEALSRRESS